MQPTTTRAAALAAAFQYDKRSDGSQFLRLADGSPDWMREAVWAAHDEELPNDWRFELALRAAMALRDNPEADPSELAAQVAEEISTVHTGELLAWYAELPGRLDYAEQARSEYGADAADDVCGFLQLGQHLAAEQAVSAMFSALEAQ